MHGDDYENRPMRRRSDDLTVNEFRLLQLERKIETTVSRDYCDRMEKNLRESIAECREDVLRLWSAVNSIRIWIVGAGLTTTGVIVTAVVLIAGRGH